MSDMKKDASGIEPVGDDELNSVSGGVSDKDANNAKEQAKSDGRTIMLQPLVAGLCVHNYQYKYAKTFTKSGLYWTYYDIKCYKCGKTWKEEKTLNMVL